MLEEALNFSLRRLCNRFIWENFAAFYIYFYCNYHINKIHFRTKISWTVLLQCNNFQTVFQNFVRFIYMLYLALSFYFTVIIYPFASLSNAAKLLFYFIKVEKLLKKNFFWLRNSRNSMRVNNRIHGFIISIWQETYLKVLSLHTHLID